MSATLSELNDRAAIIAGALAESEKVALAGMGYTTERGEAVPEIYASVKDLDLCLTVTEV